MDAVLTELERVAAVERAVPEEGLFAEKDWLISPTALPLAEKFVKELEGLGYRLLLFVSACNLLYQQSVRGKQPAWIADYLDRGKPEALRELARAREFRDDLPLVLRPDLVLTENGYTVAELDNVPGGIGLTAWLNQTYAALGEDVIGGAAGMVDGFRSILPGGADILVSEEAATYRPEMQWLARQAGARPNRIPVSAETASVNARMRASRCNASTSGERPLESQATSTALAQRASSTPAAPPMKASRVLSVSNWRISRLRRAPKLKRTAISR